LIGSPRIGLVATAKQTLAGSERGVAPDERIVAEAFVRPGSPYIAKAIAREPRALLDYA
jgi:hypothetical protein